MNLEVIRHELNQLAQELKIHTKSIHCYLFGSILSKDNPSDVDILFIYQSQKDVDLIRASLINLELRYPLHLLFLTPKEETRFNFLRTQNHLKIFTTVDNL